MATSVRVSDSPTIRSGAARTSVRGGFGIFYDRTPTNVLINPSGNPPFNVTASIFDGNIDTPAGGTARDFPSNLTMLPRSLKTPSVISYNFGVQQQLPGGVILDVGYVGNLARHISRTININQLPVGTRLDPPASTINQNALRPYLGYGSISMRDHGDNSNYNSMQMTVSRRVARASRSQGTTPGRARSILRPASPQNSYDARADYGLSTVHRAHLLNSNYIYELPFFGRHRQCGRAERARRMGVGRSDDISERRAQFDFGPV